MCITYVNAEVKGKVKSNVVKEFKGIDHLPLNVSELLIAKQLVLDAVVKIRGEN